MTTGTTAPYRGGSGGQRGGMGPRDRFGVAAPGADRADRATVSNPLATGGSHDPPPGRWQRLPRWKRVLLLTGIAALLLGGGCLGGWVMAGLGTVRALTLAHGVHAGETISARHLTVTAVPAGTGGYLPASRRSVAVGSVARADMTAGTVLRPKLLGRHERLPKSGQALVGLALEPGQVPSGGLVVGEPVRAVTSLSGKGGEPRLKVLVPRAPVWAVRRSGDTLTVTVLVGQEAGNRLAAYAGSKPVSLIRLGK